MRRYFERAGSDDPLLIKSVVSNPMPAVKGKSGYIYVEAFKQTHVKKAIEGLALLQYGQWSQQMMDIKQ